MSAPCEKHASIPAAGNSPCAGCEIERLRAENEVLRKDFERLNFIESRNHRRLVFRKKLWSFQGFTNYEYPVFKTLRDAIDEAINSDPLADKGQ